MIGVKARPPSKYLNPVSHERISFSAYFHQYAMSKLLNIEINTHGKKLGIFSFDLYVNKYFLISLFESPGNSILFYVSLFEWPSLVLFVYICRCVLHANHLKGFVM